jgi:RNA polymerase sigma factor (sigma-70 family)
VAAKTYPQNTRRANGSTLSQAQHGDREAFSRLMEPYRRELVAYCYRHTGSLTESEDLAQEAFLRAYGAMKNFEGRATARAWLYRIAHNLCINHVQRSRPAWESLASVGDDKIAGPSAAPEDECGGREDVRLGFVALMQSVPPRQRAALVLRDVLGWSAEEAAQILGTTVPAVKNALARARQTLARRPGGSDPAAVHDLAAADATARAMVAEWVDAFEKGNTERMVALLTGGDASAALHLTSRQTARSDSSRIPDADSDVDNGVQSRADGTDSEYTEPKRAVRRLPAPDMGKINANTARSGPGWQEVGTDGRRKR